MLLQAATHALDIAVPFTLEAAQSSCVAAGCAINKIANNANAIQARRPPADGPWVLADRLVAVAPPSGKFVCQLSGTCIVKPPLLSLNLRIAQHKL